MAPSVASLDHLVLTVRSIPATISFYTKHLGMQHQAFRPAPSSSSAAAPDGTERHALIFGQQKINLHQAGAEFEPKAGKVVPGSGDLCFVVEMNIDQVLEYFKSEGVEVLEGGQVVNRTGARGPIRSVYVRDPDENLIELSNYT